MTYSRVLSLTIALIVVLPVCAAEPSAAEAQARVEAVQKLVAGLQPQDGEIVLRGGIAKVTLPPSLRYLSPKDTATVLTKLWGNPERDTLGMLVPAGFDPLEDASWAVIITFDEDGYVKDNDAAKINYAELLADMKEQVQESNAARVKEGYEPITLIGWAAPPHYDPTAKKMHWAKELQFGKSAEHTLNYNLRLLGRRGVLVLNAVASMKQLDVVQKATPEILAAVNFQEGHRYADFNESTDKVATYGLAALVAGGAAAKAGFFKALWFGILAFKKLIIIGLIALAASFRKILNWFRGRDVSVSQSVSGQPPPAS